jgi:hypothetical protein
MSAANRGNSKTTKDEMSVFGADAAKAEKKEKSNQSQTKSTKHILQM